MKFNNKKVSFRGRTFDSIHERDRWIILTDMEKRGEIKSLKRQVAFQLIPSQKIEGKTVERPVKYIADFVYERNGETIVEDAKGCRTKDYIIKRKLMLFIHGIRIFET